MAETEQGNEPAVATSIPFKDDYRCGEERGPAPKFSCDFEETPDGEYIWNASRALLWPFSWAFFAKMHDTNLFEVEQLEEDVFNPCGLEECYAHRVTRKPISAE
eukprot:gnl/TRDRNA2_/TRDRNA2_27883_c0_seq2.p1 gnl/TRDRNA2_/TRDRNA2_27883_c0~~gnl/TRDRNA2_/TRDRNA2_27883_c0_seq2.p1  ORF type:complete len:104 (+),score=19.14 gnl/TRDRNA2_/TRDRNA2_27883_c0_seq2:123-434(+)